MGTTEETQGQNGAKLLKTGKPPRYPCQGHASVVAIPNQERLTGERLKEYTGWYFQQVTFARRARHPTQCSGHLSQCFTPKHQTNLLESRARSRNDTTKQKCRDQNCPLHLTCRLPAQLPATKRGKRKNGGKWVKVGGNGEKWGGNGGNGGNLQNAGRENSALTQKKWQKLNSEKGRTCCSITAIVLHRAHVLLGMAQSWHVQHHNPRDATLVTRQLLQTDECMHYAHV